MAHCREVVGHVLWGCPKIQRHNCGIRVEGRAKVVGKGCRCVELLRRALERRRCCGIPEQTLLRIDGGRLRVHHGLREEVRRELYAREEIWRLWYHPSTWSLRRPHQRTLTLRGHPPLLFHHGSPVCVGMLLGGSKWFGGRGWCVQTGCLGSTRCCCRDRMLKAKDSRRGG